MTFARSTPARLLVAGSLALTLSACGSAAAGSAGGTGATSASAGPAVAGGTLNYALAALPKCIDPALGARGLSASQQFIETLTDQDRETGEVVPRLATAWQIQDDAKVFVLTLRDDVTFSDGTPLTAQVVKNNIDTLKALSGQGKTDTPLISALNTYVGTEVVDEYTVRVEFSQAELGFLRNLSDPYFAIYAQSTVDESYDDRCAGKGLVSAGPFVIDSVVKDQKIELTRRDGYAWAPQAVTEHQGQAYLDRIVFEVVPESGVRVGGLRSGDFDVIDEVPVVDQDSVAASGNEILRGIVPNLVPGIRQNPYSPFGGDVVVRQALQKGVDRIEIRDTLYNASYTLPTSVVASNTPLWADESSLLDYDPDGAKALLEADGWALGSDGVYVKDGQRLAPRLIFTPGSSQGATQQELELIQQQLKKIGVDLQLVPLTASESTAFLSDIKTAPYDFLTGSGPAKDIDFIVGLFKKTNPALKDADQPELEAAADKLNVAATDADRVTAAADLQKLIIGDGYWIPVREQTRVIGIAQGVQGVAIDPYGGTVLYDAWKQEQ